VNSDVTGYWNIVWLVQNTGAKSVKLNSVRLPHGQFKAAEKQFDPPLELAAGSAAQFETLVYCAAPEGLVIENAFLIFNATWDAQPWRIFARIRVAVNAWGKPESTTELVTTQKVGFSGVLN
jgi:hypothetical protein